jgi:hypothetical protein
MKKELVLTKPIRSSSLVEAIQIICSPVFGSLNVANAIGGAQTDDWQIIREFTPAEIVDEIINRGLDIGDVKAACCDLLVIDTPVFHNIMEYDPRPRCPLCCRRHVIDKRTGDPLSCGDSQGFRNSPIWRWTRATAEAAVNGTYEP